MSDPRPGEIWSVRHSLAEGAIVDCTVIAVIDGEQPLSQQGRQDTRPVPDDVVFAFVGATKQHRCSIDNFHRLYVRRVMFAAELRSIARDTRRLAGGDVSLREIVDRCEALADQLVVGI